MIKPDEMFAMLSYSEYMVRVSDLDRVFVVESEYQSGNGRVVKTVKTMLGREVTLVDGAAVLAAQARMKLEVKDD